VYALAAAGLVLTYRTSRVFNFAHGAVGMFSAYLFYQATEVWGMPVVPAALLVVVGMAPALGVLLDRLVFRSLRDAPTSVKVVVTVGLLVALQGAVSLIWGDRPRFLPPPFPEGSVRVLGGVHLGYDQLGILVVSLATLGVLGAVIRWTPFGLRVRATVDRRDLAELVGVNTGWVSAASWAMGFATSAVAGILLSPVLGLDAFVLTLFVIQAFAAALLGRLESFPLTLAGGLLIAFLEEAATAYLPAACEPCLAVRPAVPFALVFAILAVAALVPRSSWGRWVRRGVTEPAAPAPGEPRRGRWGLLGGMLLVGLLVAGGGLLDGPWLLRVERGLAMAGVFASFVVLAGLSGQISLAHTAFAGTGAFVMAALTANGVPFVPALALAALTAVPVAVFVALPAIRLQGLHVALITFGFGLVVSRLFESSTITGGTTGMTVGRPGFAPTDGAYYYVLLAVAVALVLAARNLQRSPTGRVLGAIRDSEVAARAIGVNLPLYRLAVFALSAFMAGAAGAVLGGLQRLVTFNDFHPLLALMWLSVAVIGGLSSPWGAVVAGALWAVGGSSAGAIAQLGFGAGAMFLARNERGLAGLLATVPRRLARMGHTLGRAAAVERVAPVEASGNGWGGRGRAEREAIAARSP
jgi:branched-chain amino acid transport system permease protein